MNQHNHIHNEDELHSKIAQYIHENPAAPINDQGFSVGSDILSEYDLCPYSVVHTCDVYDWQGEDDIWTQAVNYVARVAAAHVYQTHTNQALRNIDTDLSLPNEPEIAASAAHISATEAVYKLDNCQPDRFLFCTLSEMRMLPDTDYEGWTVEDVLEDHPVEVLGFEETWHSFTGAEITHHSVDKTLPPVEYIYTPTDVFTAQKVEQVINNHD